MEDEELKKGGTTEKDRETREKWGWERANLKRGGATGMRDREGRKGMKEKS